MKTLAMEVGQASIVIIIYVPVYCRNKMRGGKIKKVSDFMYLSGFSVDFMEGETFWCIAEAVYQGFFCEGPGFYFGEVRPKAEPNQNKTLAPNKKKPW